MHSRQLIAFGPRVGARAVMFVALAAAAAPAQALSCTVTPQSVPFGSYDTLAPGPVDGVGTIRIACDADTSFTVALGPGAGTHDARQMQNGTDTLGYNLYTDAPRLVVWGDGVAGGSTVSASGTSVDLPVYGRIPARQNARAGSYSDMIVVTVSF